MIRSRTDADKGEEADDSGTGPIIKQALDNHVALVDLLLKSGADSNLKDKEGHTARDFDFHPDADAAVLDLDEILKFKAYHLGVNFRGQARGPAVGDTDALDFCAESE